VRIFDLGGLVVFKDGRRDKDAAWKGKGKGNGGWAEIEDSMRHRHVQGTMGCHCYVRESVTPNHWMRESVMGRLPASGREHYESPMVHADMHDGGWYS